MDDTRATGGGLAWVEHLLPGGTGAERLGLARELGLALEVALRPGLDVGGIARSGLEVATVQAWELHDVHALSPDPADVERARAHVGAAIDLAARLGAPRVLTVCGFATEPVADAPRRCAELFASLAERARARGVRLLIEPLSRERTAVLSGPEPVAALLRALPPDVFGVALDTGHLLDHGLDPAAVLPAWEAIDELQVRGPAGAFPDAALPVEAWLAACPRPPGLVVPEFRAPAGPEATRALARRLRRALQPRP